MKNWKTSLFGTLATLLAAMSQIPTLDDYKGIFVGLAAICGTLASVFAKDRNVTGGTTRQ